MLLLRFLFVPVRFRFLCVCVVIRTEHNLSLLPRQPMRVRLNELFRVEHSYQNFLAMRTN